MRYVDAKTPAQRREPAREIFEEVRKEAAEVIPVVSETK